MSDNAKLVYSHDPAVAVAKGLEDCQGDIDALIAKITTKSCSYTTARQLSVVVAPLLGISEADFMKRWRASQGTRRGESN